MIEDNVDDERSLATPRIEATKITAFSRSQNLRRGLRQAEQRSIVRQAYAGLLWTKQYYNYVVKEWLEGDPGMPPPPPGHRKTRNTDWEHLFNSDVISMPDKWEYPWYAAWDLAFHMMPLARIDPQFSQRAAPVVLARMVHASERPNSRRTNGIFAM